MTERNWLLLGIGLALACSAQAATQYDLLIRNAVIYDGTGGEPVRGAVAVQGDSIAAIGALPDAHGKLEIDAGGLAVCPGFINMLSWSNESLIYDGRSQSEIRQGVTLEVLGEGNSMGPLSKAMKRKRRERQDDGAYTIEWTTLGEYLQWLERREITPNVTSFVGAATVRNHEIGLVDRRATPQELRRMCDLVRQAMREGAVGVSSALIYPPGAFADTEELVALATAAGEFGGLYISHIRGEGDHLLEALDEFLTIVRRAKVRGEIYHLKAGKGNWAKFDEVLRRIEAARVEGLPVTADMYPYNASGTGLATVLPLWVQEGGHDACVKRLRDPATRERAKREMDLPEGGSHILLSGIRNERLRPLIGKRLSEIAAERGASPQDTAIDLLIEGGHISAVFFSMSEENVRKGLSRPWVSLCSDAASIAPEGSVLKRSPHPRAYGSFARFLGHYVRDQKLVPLQEAIRRMTSLPAGNLKLERRGRLAVGHFADIVVFDPAAIQDHATYAKPHQYSTGVKHVFVNGVQVLRDGEHTGARPGRFVRGPGASR